MCVYCAARGIVTTDELEAHHIVPIEEDYELRLEDDNLITLCAAHHRLADAGKISRDYLRELISDTTPRGDGDILSGRAARPAASDAAHKIP